MTDNPSSLPVPSSPASGSPLGIGATRPLWRQPLFWIAVLALALATWQWIETRQRLLETQEQVARRLADEAASARETRVLAAQAQAGMQELRTRLGVVDNKLGEFQSQQVALEALYQELARGRDEWTLAEVEQTLSLAVQQLQIAGNVPAAVLALTNADARLARADRPQFVALRKAIAVDLGRLQALPFVDVVGISSRLESAVAAADGLALAFAQRPRGDTTPAPPAAVADPAWWQRIAHGLWQDVRGLVRIQRFDRPEPALLAPEHSFFLRENLKLRLLNARLALLARDQATFRGELRQAVTWLERYFEPGDAAVQAAQASLKALLTTNVAIELPTLSDSLSALRTVRLGRKDGVS